MVRAFPDNVCARVLLVLKWALVRRGVAISIGLFAVVELAACEFEEGGALLWVRGAPYMDGPPTYYVNVGPLLCVGDNNAPVEIDGM